jgi:hypothetical protein
MREIVSGVASDTIEPDVTADVAVANAHRNQMHVLEDDPDNLI